MNEELTAGVRIRFRSDPLPPAARYTLPTIDREGRLANAELVNLEPDADDNSLCWGTIASITAIPEPTYEPRRTVWERLRSLLR